MPNGTQPVQGPDGNLYQFPSGTTKEAAISYFKKKGIGAPSTGTPIKDTSTLQARPKGVGTWLENLEGDIRTGQGSTWLGRAFKKMGAPGLETGVSKEAGEFIGSPVLGATHAAQGLAMLPSHPWEGTKKAVGGTLEALTIPGLVEAAPEEGGANLLAKGEELWKARSAAKAATKATGQLGKINELLGVGAKELRTGKSPGKVQEFVTNPARGVLKSGLDEKALAKMTPVERHQAIVAAKDAAGKKLGEAFKAASDAGTKLDLKSAVDNIFKEIPDRKLMAQTRAKLTMIINRAMGKPNVFEEVPYSQLLKELSSVTPSQAHAIRMGLDDFASFASGESAKTFGDVATSLRRAIATEIRKVLPGTKEDDQLFSDLAGAAKGTEKKLKQFAKKGPEPSLLQKIAKGAKKEITERPIRTAAYGLGVPYVGHEIFAKRGSSPVP